MTTKTATIHFSHHTKTIEIETSVLMDLVNMAHNRLTERQAGTKAQAAEIDFSDRSIARGQIEALLDQHQDAAVKLGLLDRIETEIKAPAEITGPDAGLDLADAAETIRRFANVVESGATMPLQLLNKVSRIVQSFPPF